MLKVNALRLEINTTGGLFGLTIKFNSGLNIVRANNTVGKSTIFQSILYGLGFEELLGGRNEKTMQSVLKDEVLDEDQKKFKVLQSFVLLEIENKEIVTIRRSVTEAKNRRSVLIDVIYGSYIFERTGNFEIRQMFVHERGMCFPRRKIRISFFSGRVSGKLGSTGSHNIPSGDFVKIIVYR